MRGYVSEIQRRRIRGSGMSPAARGHGRGRCNDCEIHKQCRRGYGMKAAARAYGMQTSDKKTGTKAWRIFCWSGTGIRCRLVIAFQARRAEGEGGGVRAANRRPPREDELRWRCGAPSCDGPAKIGLGPGGRPGAKAAEARRTPARTEEAGARNRAADLIVPYEEGLRCWWAAAGCCVVSAGTAALQSADE